MVRSRSQQADLAVILGFASGYADLGEIYATAAANRAGAMDFHGAFGLLAWREMRGFSEEQCHGRMDFATRLQQDTMNTMGFDANEPDRRQTGPPVMQAPPSGDRMCDNCDCYFIGDCSGGDKVVFASDLEDVDDANWAELQNVHPPIRVQDDCELHDASYEDYATLRCSALPPVVTSAGSQGSSVADAAEPFAKCGEVGEPLRCGLPPPMMVDSQAPVRVPSTLACRATQPLTFPAHSRTPTKSWADSFDDEPEQAIPPWRPRESKKPGCPQRRLPSLLDFLKPDDRTRFNGGGDPRLGELRKLTTTKKKKPLLTEHSSRRRLR
eukprot:TRINITY_DN64429_c0_g1_i3.p1 TRINITY_DN64429_c0_g1~~TRINITY_DN64429_c0_g1_i3.p1  ORF type:complete len:325 (-),score=46.56 TRINITY_DN64429_c0_g1_i3:308-1282(-)